MTIIQLEKIEIPPLGVHLVLEVEVNGIPTRMVLDTGASRSVIDSNYLHEICPEIETEEERLSSVGVGADDLESFVAIIDQMNFNGYKLEQYSMAVMDLSHVKASYNELEIETVYGVIGGDILSKNLAVIDYLNLSLTFNKV